MPPKPRPLEDRFWEKVSKLEANECWEWTAHKHWTGYGMIDKLYAHRVSWSILYGKIAADMEIDHICHNPGCVNPNHLREATRKQNIENHQGPKKNSKSGVRGVMFHPQTGKWRPRVRHNGVVHYFGLYENLEDAEAAVIAKRNELHTFNNADRKVD